MQKVSLAPWGRLAFSFQLPPLYRLWLRSIGINVQAMSYRDQARGSDEAALDDR